MCDQKINPPKLSFKIMRARVILLGLFISVTAAFSHARNQQVLADTIINNQPYVLLNNGLEMPRFGIGTFNVPGDSVMADAISFALKNGYRHIDTAHAYRIERE